MKEILQRMSILKTKDEYLENKQISFIQELTHVKEITTTILNILNLTQKPKTDKIRLMNKQNSNIQV